MVPASSAALTISNASAAFVASVFSQTTALPAAMASRQIALCTDETGVTTTRLTAGSAITSP